MTRKERRLMWRLREWMSFSNTQDLDIKNVGQGNIRIKLYFDEAVEEPKRVIELAKKTGKAIWNWRGYTMSTSVKPLRFGGGWLSTRRVKSGPKSRRAMKLPRRNLVKSGEGESFWVALERAFKARAEELV